MNLSIANKIFLGFGLVLALTVALGVYVMARFSEVREITTSIVDQDLDFMDHLRQLRRDQDAGKLAFERLLSRHLLAKNGSTALSEQEAINAWQDARHKTQGLLHKLKTDALSSEGALAERRSLMERIAQSVDELESLFGRIVAEVEPMFPMIEKDQFAQLEGHLAERDRLRGMFDQQLDGMRDEVKALVELGKREIAAAHDAARSSNLLALSTILMLGIASSLLIQRSISRPLARFVTLAHRVGEGDLANRAEGFGRDEFGRLAESFNQMIDGLRRFAEQTSAATAGLNSASNQILAATEQQTASTSEQATSVQETTTTMQEISAAGSQISERARHVAKANETTSDASLAGLQAVQEMNDAMTAIQQQAEAVAQNIVVLSEKTQTVGEIIRTVNDLAEQSNLLALNAGIEAAAAGDHGRSFAVVANEMKALADQAKEATVQVQSILGEIQRGINTSVMLTEEAVKRVATGRERSEVADTTIRAMASSIRESITTFQQIVAATNQQQIGLEQVTMALKNVTGATAETASGTRQLEASARTLNDLARSLVATVETYRL